MMMLLLLLTMTMTMTMTMMTMTMMMMTTTTTTTTTMTMTIHRNASSTGWEHAERLVTAVLAVVMVIAHKGVGHVLHVFCACVVRRRCRHGHGTPLGDDHLFFQRQLTQT
jgi:hypothetical protein